MILATKCISIFFVSQQTTECLTDLNYIPVGCEFTKNLEKHGLFCISKAQWDLLACSDRMNPSWVHAMAHGLSSLNKCCCFAFNTVSVSKVGENGQNFGKCKI